MRALVAQDGIEFRRDYPRPKRMRGESLIAVSLAGICSTDLEIARGYMDFRGVLGHEFVGKVVESDRDDLRGLRVVGEINCPCGTCDMCLRGLGKHCASRSVLGIAGRDGAFADYLVLPDANLHILPGILSDRQAVFTEPLAAACRAFDQASPGERERTVVLGDGRLGILVAQVLRARSRSVKLVGRHGRKLAVASGLGIETIRESEVTGRREADIVIEATGSESGLGRAIEMVRPTGRIILKTTIASPYAIDLAPIVVNEVTLTGSRCGSFGEALSLLERGAVKVEEMISAVYPLEKGREALEAAASGALKVLLDVARTAPS